MSAGGWAKLAAITGAAYTPVIDTLRMHTMEFTWTKEGEKLKHDTEILDRLRREWIDAMPSGRDAPALKHFPVARAQADKAIRVTCSAAHQSGLKTVILRYQAAGGAERAVLMHGVAGQEWVYGAMIPAADARKGTISYTITAERPEAGSPGGEQTATVGPYTIQVGADRTPPTITNLGDDHQGTAPETTITANVSDDTAIGEVTLWWRPLPSGEQWQSQPMGTVRGPYQATVPVTSDGLLYYVEAVDQSGNGAQYPDFRKERPYRVIAPWPAEGQ
jgi:hypothetical protein